MLLNENFTHYSSNGTISIEAPNPHTNFHFPYSIRIMMYMFLGFIFICGTTGNAIVIYIIGIKHRLVRSFDIHVVALATTDFYSSTFLPLVTIHDLVTNLQSWHLFGRIGCKILAPMNHATVLASALILATISISRLRVIQSAVAFRQSRLRSVIEIGVVWIVALIVVSSYMNAFGIKRNGCYDQWSSDGKMDTLYRFIYFTCYQSIACFIPFITMIAVYTASMYFLTHKKIPGNCQGLLEKRKQRNMRIIKMFGMIVTLFFIFNMPYMISVMIYTALHAFQPTTIDSNAERYFLITNYCLYTFSAINSCINPFIYARMHQSMRKFLHKHWGNGLNTRRMSRISSFDRLGTINL